MTALPDLTLTTLDHHTVPLSAYAGQVLLVVNVASQCGFTKQYAELEQLYRTYRERGFAVLGFPCDQFGHQEPGDADEIRRFCHLNYEVTFPLFAKTKVNGPHTHPLFAHLKEQARGVLWSRAIKWNFTKFLIGREGRVRARYAPMRAPLQLAHALESALSA